MISENKQHKKRSKLNDPGCVLALITGVSTIACIFGLCAAYNHRHAYQNEEIDRLRKQLIKTKEKYYDLLEERLYTLDAFKNGGTK